MKINTIWDWIEGLAAALDGDRQDSEEMVNRLERELKLLSKQRRDEMRRLIIHIIAGLSRLEVRMMEHDGPIKSTV
jgi:hypothetical protein